MENKEVEEGEEEEKVEWITGIWTFDVSEEDIFLSISRWNEYLLHMDLTDQKGKQCGTALLSKQDVTELIENLTGALKSMEELK